MAGDKKISITISPMLASVMQRMIEEEKNRQVIWSRDDHEPVRQTIIKELDALSNDLESKGAHKYFRCS